MENYCLALIIIFNHKYDKNINFLKKIYEKRFSNIFFLVPFYEGEEENVIPIYENSHYFQGYIAQGFRQYFDKKYSHYLFIGDDLILNPLINEKNYHEIFLLDKNSGFIPNLDDMPGGNWPHNRAALTYNPYRPGVEIKNEIPSPEEAKKKISALKVKNIAYRFKDVYFFDGFKSFNNVIKNVITYFYDTKVLGNDLKGSKYPYIRSYADIFIVSAPRIKKFIHYCGAFAASDLWVELAIPTALILAGEKVKTEKDTKLKGKPLWTENDYKELDQYNFELKELMSNFPKNYLYLHPVKLSKWKVEDNLA